jgi:plasmid replication initiation protein
VVQDNSLIRSAYTMPLNTKRLFLLATSKINSMNFAGINTCIGVTVSAEEWNKLYGGTNVWKELKLATQDLMKRHLMVCPLDKKYQRVINFCDSVDYYHRESRCEIRFSYSISKMLAGMLDEFTKVDLLNVAKFDSKHSVRVYELLNQMKNTNEQWWLRIGLDEFRACMGLSDRQYQRFAELKRTVITPSINEINSKSDLSVEVEYLKRGRKIDSLHFRFKPCDQMFIEW